MTLTSCYEFRIPTLISGVRPLAAYRSTNANFLHRHLRPLPGCLIICTHEFASLGIDTHFSTRFSYPCWMILPFASGDTIYLEKALEKTKKIWTSASGGSLLLISCVYRTDLNAYYWWLYRLSVALFQTNAVSTTSWGKTLAITTFTLAFTALLSSVIILADRNSLLHCGLRQALRIWKSCQYLGVPIVGAINAAAEGFGINIITISRAAYALTSLKHWDIEDESRKKARMAQCLPLRQHRPENWFKIVTWIAIPEIF